MAKEIFSRLFGVEPHVDQPHNVGLRVDGQETGLDPKGRDKGMTPTNTSSPHASRSSTNLRTAHRTCCQARNRPVEAPGKHRLNTIEALA